MKSPNNCSLGGLRNVVILFSFRFSNNTLVATPRDIRNVVASNKKLYYWLHVARREKEKSGT